MRLENVRSYMYGHREEDRHMRMEEVRLHIWTSMGRCPCLKIHRENYHLKLRPYL